MDIWNKQPCARFDGKYFIFLNKSKKWMKKSLYYKSLVSYYKCCRNEGYKTYCAFASVE